MKKNANQGSQHPKLPTTEQLCEIWKKVLSDPDAHRALDQLDKAGFGISHLKPRDATFKHPCWADYIAAAPLLSNKPSTRYIHLATSARKYRPLVRELREFAAAVKAPFVEVRFFLPRDCPVSDTVREDLLKAASTLEHYFSWNYYVRSLNPVHALIAELRWTIRQRTGRPHDRELNCLFDAAFRAAGYEEGCYIDSTALDRIENRQRESRVKANRRIRYLINAPAPLLRRSTRIRRNSRKRV